MSKQESSQIDSDEMNLTKLLAFVKAHQMNAWIEGGFKMPEIRIYNEGNHPDSPWAAEVATDDPGHLNPRARFKTEASAWPSKPTR